eukprot:517646-Hanusia_phi.AAC.1
MAGGDGAFALYDKPAANGQTVCVVDVSNRTQTHLDRRFCRPLQMSLLAFLIRYVAGCHVWKLRRWKERQLEMEY